jgi:hypothetical protein
MMKRSSISAKLFQFSRLIPAIGLAGFWLGVVVPAALAQSIALAPGQVQYRFKPGQPFEFELYVSNKGAAPVSMRVSTTDFWYNEKNEKVFSAPGSSPRSAANWIEVVPRQLSVPAAGTGKVRIIVTPPLQVSGGYYAVVFVESRPELVEAATDERKAVYTNMRLGSLILLSAENTEDYNVEVTDAQFTPPAANQSMRLDFLLSNKSNTHVFPETKVAILNSRHEVIAKAEGEKKRFLPGQKDRLSVSWAGTLPAGSYTAILTVLYGQDKNYTQEFPFAVAGAP